MGRIKRIKGTDTTGNVIITYILVKQIKAALVNEPS